MDHKTFRVHFCMDSDEIIEVNVDGEIHVFAKSDIKMRLGSPGETNVWVEVNYAGKKYKGTVGPKEAKKLHPKSTVITLNQSDTEDPFVDKPKFHPPTSFGRPE